MSGERQYPDDRAPLVARLLSVEFVSWFIAIVFGAGVVYSAIAKDTKANKTAIDNTQVSVDALVSDVSEIKISLEGINQTRKAEATAVQLRAQVVDRRMDDMQEDIKSVLRLLREGRR